MYVFGGLSSPAIARLFGSSPQTIRNILHTQGVELRTKTSVRACPKCGQPSFKLRAHNGKQRVLKGRLCREHARENWREKNQGRKDR